jgi:hypothetical protein|tara:strand:+ start:78 stop:539 length:462 start_codon:yes stop_codon:yes gene_type:complete
MITTVESKGIKSEAIINLINKYFNLNCRDLGRESNKVIARQMAMYYIRKGVKLSYDKIGRLFPSKDSAAGYKGHVTVRHSVKTIEDLIQVDQEIKEYQKDLDYEVELIATLNIIEIEEYKLRADTFEKLKQLNESELKRVNLYLDHYFLNRMD